jgi:hypothetical protein
MENEQTNLMQTRTTAKDFFLHLGMIVSLYAVVVAFLNLLFRVIDQAFPNMITNAYYWTSGAGISMPVATLIVIFPVFVFLSWLVYKSYEENERKKDLGIRKWLIYITLFVAGIILAGDLVSIIYKFLDGQDLTSAFLLKSLSVFVVMGAVFGYFLCDLKDRMTPSKRKIWMVSVSVLILLAIVLGFSVIGSPKTQRLLKYDNEKINQISNMQMNVINYWQENGMIPETLPNPPIDRQTGEAFEYTKTGNMTFEICAEFNLPNEMQNDNTGIYRDKYMGKNEDWDHPAGRHCFEREIDPVMYPTRVRG